jgi:hypothetical protein
MSAEEGSRMGRKMKKKEGRNELKSGTYTASEEETGGIRGGIVREPDLHSILGELVGIGSRHDVISLNSRVGNLHRNVSHERSGNHSTCTPRQGHEHTNTSAGYPD